MQKIINPDIRNFVNVTSHPAGCVENIRQQIKYAAATGPGRGIGNALVIGSSTGYGLASMITAVFGYGAAGLGVCFEKPVNNRRSASPGYYNIAALHRLAKQNNKHIATLNGDAFSHEIRREVINILQQRYGQLDYIIYSLASSRRQDPDSEQVFRSRIQPLESAYSTKTINLKNGEIGWLTLPPATPEEVRQTVKVMGGGDWQLWMQALQAANLLAPGCRTVAYTYIGTDTTARIYRSGTIGAAKKDLEQTALVLDKQLQQSLRGHAWVCACQGLVTKASSVIPAMPLYLSLLKRAMTGERPYETAIEQITRLFHDYIAPDKYPELDTEQRIRIDDRELSPAVQAYIRSVWPKITTANLAEYADFEGFKTEFLQSAGFLVDDVDYTQPVEVDVEW